MAPEGEDARPGHHAAVHGHLEPEDGSAGVAHGGEAAHKCRAGLLARDKMDECNILCQSRDLAHADQGRVPVAVDQTRRHCAPAAVYDVGIFRARTCRGQGRDTAVRDKDVAAGLHCEGGAIEEAEVRQESRASRRLRTQLARGQAEAREHADHGSGTA